MAYRRVTVFERRCIRRWSQAGCNQSEISRRLDRPRSTVSREIARNTGGNGYQPEQANRMAQERAKRPGPRRFTEEVMADAEARLCAGWTPDMIGVRARLEGRPWVCKETIYKHIYADAKGGGDLWKNLPRAHRKRRRRCPRDDNRRRGHIPNRRMIDTRPPEVETRTTVGHWEGDLINGANKTGNLVTLVERKTRFTLVDRTDTKEALEVTQTMCRLFGKMPQASRLSLTLDNGKEFARHEQVAKKTCMDVFFARPYHSWERGTNENTNGLIRRLYPKKSSFSEIGKPALKRIDSFLNDRPRKCLGWLTPREKMTTFLASTM
jgi:transposase, IS30 family